MVPEYGPYRDHVDPSFHYPFYFKPGLTHTITKPINGVLPVGIKDRRLRVLRGYLHEGKGKA